MRYLLQITLTVVLLASIAGAQEPQHSWDNLRTLRTGEKIQVVDQKLKSQNGTFVSFSDEDITFLADKNTVMVQRADVLRVSSRERGRTRGKNALIGLAVGAGIGLGLGAAMYPSMDVSQAEAVTASFVGVPLMFGGIGAGVGAVLPTGQPTIYRAERRKDQTAH